MIRPRRRVPVPASIVLVAAWVAVAAPLAACQPAQSPAPNASGLVGPSPSEGLPRADIILGCVSVAEAECQFVLDGILGVLPPERGAPASVQIVLAGCPNPDVPCANTLGARDGNAVVEYVDGDEPITLFIEGPPVAPKFQVIESTWSGLIQPGTPPVGNGAAVAFEIGHCGLSHVVDFDGAFWVPVGAVDGDAPGYRNAESGQIRLLDPKRAQYQGPNGFSVTLARFPGPKHFFMCD